MREGFRLEGLEAAETLEIKFSVRERVAWIVFVRNSSVSLNCVVMLPRLWRRRKITLRACSPS